MTKPDDFRETDTIEPQHLPGSRENRGGYTLIELTIAMVLFSFVTLFAYQIYKADNKVFIEQFEVVDMQQNARIGLDQLVRDMRLAGAGVPTGGVDSDIGYLYPVVPGDGGGSQPDTISILSDFKNVRTQLSHPMPNEAAVLKVTDASDFEVDALGIIIGPTVESGNRAELFKITHVSTSGQHMIQHGQSPPWNLDQKMLYTYIPPSKVYMISYRTYFIDNSDPDHPCLVVSENGGVPQVLADNIENLQFVYDLTGGEKDVAAPDDPISITKATVTLTARTNTSDQQWNNGVSSIDGSSDHYRRLILMSDVKMRNLNP